VTAVGYGLTSPDGSPSNDLLKVNLFVVPQTTCRQAMSNEVADSMICATAPGKDTCNV